MHRRVLFILKWRVVPYDGRSWGWMDPGTPRDPSAKLLSHGLNNSCRFIVEMLLAAGVEAKLVQVADDNDIWKEIVEFDPDLVVIEAYWMRPKKLVDLEERFPGLPIVIRGHSSTPFLADDAVGFPWAVEYLKLGGTVGQNDPRHVTEMRFLAANLFGLFADEATRRVPYLPNFYPTAHHGFIEPNKDHGDDVIDVGCFGAIRSFKNHVGQAIAAMMLADRIGRRLRFHVNGDRLERGGNEVSRALEAIFAECDHAELVRHDWIPTHPEFKELVASMDLVTQVSFAETFCIVAADAASQGVALVTSPEVRWADRRYQADPTDVVEIARVMLLAWEEPTRVARANYHGLAEHGVFAQSLWLEFLG